MSNLIKDMTVNNIETSDNENSPMRVDGPYYINFSDNSYRGNSDNNSFSVGQYQEIGDKREHEAEFQEQKT